MFSWILCSQVKLEDVMKEGESRIEILYTTTYGVWDFPTEADDVMKVQGVFSSSSIHRAGRLQIKDSSHWTSVSAFVSAAKLVPLISMRLFTLSSNKHQRKQTQTQKFIVNGSLEVWQCLTSVIWSFTLTAFIVGSCLCCALIEAFKLWKKNQSSLPCNH